MRLCARLLLAGTLLAGSLLLWLGIPTAWLWLFSRLADHYFDAYLATLGAAPPTMVAWGWVLHRINLLYLRATHGRTSASARPEARRASALLDACMVTSVILALGTLLIWLLLHGGPGNHPAQGAW